ncbi:MAG TPA: NUDIX domain-containing protein [Bacilli bacterium]|nr:MAG: RNA pyrophosphohydrolase [Tenericutes bacterium ADurb.BinA124]HNZ50554.1 NUDIX domain-containing protein [Bacilli bacterium]HOH18380.1 NUDIX domain-containing protein [Bacilli bacterium]HPN61527.1 NUDIX domain-containing protein [Bacilli bacterium]HPX84744.1 NUDIX domain-containing protein [Bacilli bacterium]
MRTLFVIDTKDYDLNGKVYRRPSTRGIIIRGNKVGMIHSRKYDYYTFPGGGIEPGENQINTLIREVKEETGLEVILGSIKEFGLVHSIQKGKTADEAIFIQDNYYYLCEVRDEWGFPKLDDYESAEQFTFEWIEAMQGIVTNRHHDHGTKNPIMIEREARVLEILIQEKYLQ